MAKPIKVGIIGGTGFDNPDIFEYPRQMMVDTQYGLPSDVIIQGKINKVNCALLGRHGRKHFLAPNVINYRANIWALYSVECTHIISTTATASLQENMKPGDIVFINSFIDRTRGRDQTFYDGGLMSPEGICHLRMEPPFCNRTRNILIDCAKELGLPYHEKGAVVTVDGPRYPTRSESLLFREWGGDIMNMTTVPEVVLAKEVALCYATIAIVTDYECWKSKEECVSHSIQKNISNIIRLIQCAVPKIAAEDWSDTFKKLEDNVEESVILPIFE